MIANLEAVALDLMGAAAIIDAAGGFGRKLQQRLDGSGRGPGGAQLQYLSKQDEDGDDSGGFEIDRDRAAMSAECRREDPGRNGSYEAVNIGPASAARDQGEH